MFLNQRHVLRVRLSSKPHSKYSFVYTSYKIPEQNYTVKGKSIQDNQHWVRGILEEMEDDTDATLIRLDQSKAFDRVDHWFLAVILETTTLKPEFRTWISILYHLPPVSSADEQKAHAALLHWAVGPAGLHPVSSSLRFCIGAPAP